MHVLTANGSWRVRFDIVTFDGRWMYAEYSTFVIGPESDNYRLHIAGYTGNASNFAYLAFINFVLGKIMLFLTG